MQSTPLNVNVQLIGIVYQVDGVTASLVHALLS